MKLSKKTVYPWIVVLCCCAMATASIAVAINCMGVYYAPIAEELNVGLGSVSLYLTILNLTSGFFGPVVIQLTKKIDIRVILGVGGLGSALAYVGLANVNALWQIYALALIQGLLVAMCGMVLVTTLVSNWFSKAMGVAAGLSLSFSGLMGAVLSPVFNNIIAAQGWRTSYYVGAIIVAACIIPALIFVRLHPSDIGLPRFGESEVSVPAVTAAGGKKEKDSALLKSLPAILAMAISFIAAFLSGLGSHIANYASSVGIDSSIGALMISAVMVGNMTSKLVGGILCDILKPKRAVILILALSVLGCLMLAVFPGAGTAVMLLAGFLVGTSYSICGVGLSTLSREIFGAEKFASVYSYVTIAGFVGSAIAFTAIGYSYDLFASFIPAVSFCAVIAVLSIFFVTVIYKKARK